MKACDLHIVLGNYVYDFFFRKGFPKMKSLSKVFDKNTVKMSRSCNRNKSTLSVHYRQIRRPKTNLIACNFRHNSFPLDDK